MKNVIFLSVIAALFIFAASCGRNASKRTENEQQTEQSVSADGADKSETRAYIKFDGTTLLVDEFVWIFWNDTVLIEKYGLGDKELFDDYYIVNEVVNYEEWKLLPDATFSIIKYVPEMRDGKEYTVIVSEYVSRAEFTEYMKPMNDLKFPYPPMIITGSRSGVSRIEQFYIP